MNKTIRKLNFIRITLWVVLIIITFFCCMFIADKITCALGYDNGAACEKIGIITYEERFRKEDGSLQVKHNFNNVENGDIFISDSTHTLGWRHGHAGIVVDSEKGKILEAAIWGKPSEISALRYWRTYGSVKHLRIKENIAEKSLEKLGVKRDTSMSGAAQLGNIAAEFAAEYGNNVQYGLLTGIGDKSPAPEEFKKTQCAHLVWYVYYNMGIDIDGDGGWLVTPNDIQSSEYLDALEAFGYTKP